MIEGLIELIGKVLTQYGFGVFMTIVMVTFFCFLAKWTMQRVDENTFQANHREEALLNIIEGYKEEMSIHREQTSAAHSHHREEHEKMIDLLDQLVEKVSHSGDIIKEIQIRVDSK